ncbi:ABC transporter permease [Jatrophihabitans lederbergiae]|uniref:Transport permease protein n=1 Tax=Jatrophihabitans lederbergiae TaxID=3075547 RepID=A0ABU2JE84_9ACTN|nr:ABC transporter permease [Jatrophihabitans sp. DSM 44399]MDT0263292.1 ABC transporter permease [Jatrophihabitans sp. DSM 44399]
MSASSIGASDRQTATAEYVRAGGGGIPALFEYFAITARRYFKVSAISQLGAPVLYLLALGVGLGSVVNKGTGAGSLGISYLSFIAPALVAATALQVGAGEATYPILHGGFKYHRTYFGMNATPLTATQIAQATLAWIAVRAALSAVLYLLVVAGFGGLRSIASVLTVPVAALGAMAFAAPVAAYSASIETEGGGFAAIFRFLVTPMFLFSGTFYPISTLPEWARLLAWVSPPWHATELARWVSLGPLHLRSGVGQVSGLAVFVHLAYLVALTVAGVLLTGWRYRVRLST